MLRQNFNTGWKVTPDRPLFGMLTPPPAPTEVTLPYDIMLHTPKRKDTASEGRTGYFPEGEWVYTKAFTPDPEWAGKFVAVEFEGVYMNASVYFNGCRVAFHPYGYTGFTVDLTPFLRFGEENELKVACKTYQDSRWYTGAGIYRDVHLYVSDLLHLLPDGLRLDTEALEPDFALVRAAAHIVNRGHRAEEVTAEITLLDPEGNTAGTETLPATVQPGETITLRSRFALENPRPWSPETPVLYSCICRLLREEETMDEAREDFGLRTITVDARRGFRINGKQVLLRGACIHHDNGVVGAATFASMEERRVRILQEAGFNAIRMAHHPASRAMLRACDRAGMLVMDEFSDIWTQNKSKYDYSLYFEKYWEEDIRSMAEKDYNHPSVVMYSIGNEIPETGSYMGGLWGRRLAEALRSVDTTRPITNAVNALLSLGDRLMKKIFASMPAGDVNQLISQGGENMMSKAMLLPEIAPATAESYGAVDIAGYNYMELRYESDHALFPNRVICGTEDFPKSIAYNWEIMKRCPWVIGDFTWTGWDYLGECGAYPDSLNVGGDIDATGFRRPCSYYREVIFGLTEQPYPAVQRPVTTVSTNPPMGMWGWTDTLSGWSWYGHEGEALSVEVYCPGDEAELLLNGVSLGKKRPGTNPAGVAVFTVPFAPGTLTAVSYRNGRETGRRSLTSPAGEIRLTASVEDNGRLEAARELVFVNLALTDDAGNIFHNETREVAVTVEGGSLLGYGSARPDPADYISPLQPTFEGRLFAVLRREGDAPVRAVFTAEGLPPVEILSK